MMCRLGWALAIAFVLDQSIARLMAGFGPGVDRVFTVITWFGQGGVILYPTGVFLLVALAASRMVPKLASKLRPLIASTATIFAVVAAAGLVNDLLKIMFGRARPRLGLAGDPSGFEFFRYGAKFASFPSGHTATSVAAAVVFSALFPRWRRAFIAFAVLIAVSRMVLDAHYLSDIIAGAAVGVGVALAVLAEMRRRGWAPLAETQDSAEGTVAVKGRE